MKQIISKHNIPWITIITIFFLGFYLSAQRIKSVNDAYIYLQDDNVENILDNRYSVRQKLINDFEIAFLKQYTPPAGCNVLESNINSNQCNQHLIQARNEFKQYFITTRGLPRNTFEVLKLSVAD